MGAAAWRGVVISDVAGQSEIQFAYDVTLDEIRRRRAVLEAIGEDWDPVQAMADEDMASRMLYSDLDDEQQRIFDELVRAGVLPARS
jgi:hypothetical protein